MSDKRQAIAVMNEDIECPRFRKWIPGKTPKEHEEMSLLERLRAEQQVWRTEEAKWRNETETSLNRRHHSQFVLQALIAVIGVAASIIGSLIAVGKIQLW
jgi:hypothetical protein